LKLFPFFVRAPGVLLAIVVPLLSTVFAANIGLVQPNVTTVGRYEPVIVRIDLTALTATNKFDPSQIAVDAEITKPDGVKFTYPCFYRGDSSGTSKWQLRFSPRQTGDFSYVIKVVEGGTTKTSDPVALTVTESGKNGFLHLDKTNYYVFRYDNGRPWRGAGLNFGWEEDTAGTDPLTYNYAEGLPMLSSSGANMIRAWMASSTTKMKPLEWGNGPMNYNLANADYWDRTLAFAQSKNISVKLTLGDYRQWETATDPWGNPGQWYVHPYNTAKGGYITDRLQYWTDAKCRTAFKNLLRYIVARYSYFPNIESFEYTNEITHAMGSYHANGGLTVMSNWFNEMTTYIKSIDYHGHMVTVNASDDNTQLWQNAGLEYVCRNIYRDAGAVSACQSEADGYNKPYVCGEYSLRWEGPAQQPFIDYQTNLHLAMWRGWGRKQPILALTWWWDNHLAAGDAVQIGAAGKFASDMTKVCPATSDYPKAASVGGGTETGGIFTGYHYFVWAKTGSNSTITVNNVKAQNYSVQWFDTWKGTYTKTSVINAAGTTLSIPVGAFTNSTGDIAFRIAGADSALSTGVEPVIASRSTFSPAIVSMRGFLNVTMPNPQRFTVSIVSLNGRVVATRTAEARSLKLETNGIADGVYGVTIVASAGRAVQKVQITR
jgi:hypothetical protein